MADTESKALPSWMYGNPEDFADRLIATSSAVKKQEARKKEQARRNKSKRIQVLVRQAMMKGGSVCGS